MKIPIKILLSTMISGLLIQGCAMQDPNMVRVNNVGWYPKITVDIDDVFNREVPDNTSRLIFYRPMDDDNVRTGQNIAINDDYQISLHPGNFTAVYSCVGDNRVSSNSTELLTNDLLLNHSTYDLKPKQTYFFKVEVDSNRKSSFQQVSKQIAKSEMAGMNYQSHQISKVIPHCEPRTVPAPKPPAPVLEKKVSINLKVLFDNDKSIIKPQYFNELSNAAALMKKYSDTIIIIEGHTDSNASDAYNLNLSNRRANAVKNVFINNYGIEPERISSIGYGESRPIATNSTDQGRQLNRRVVAVIEQE